jgi:dolichyl-phosphate-mannose-protein mannosyltransferase
MEPSTPAHPARSPFAVVGGNVAVVVVLGGALIRHVTVPAALVFDETHYVPAAKALAHLSADLNWEHPPLAKWIMGLGARLLAEEWHLVSEPGAFRIVTAAFGLWALLGVAGILRDLDFPEWATQLAVWLTGFNFLWFVQSRTAMLETFSVAFALAGVRLVRRGGAWSWPGWTALGLAMACKWSVAPLCVLGFLWSRDSMRRRAIGVGVAVLAYAIPFLPLALLAQDATPPWGILRYQLRMLEGFGRVDLASHPYASRFWQWPTLLRPAWFHFESGPAGERYVWAGGNPLLFAAALPATIAVGVSAIRRGAPAADRAIALLYWAPLLFWAVLSRTGVYYYFFAASLWQGPAVAWAALRLAGPRPVAARIALGSFTAACAALFLWFSPILDGRLEPPGSYHRYMWTTRWR